MSQSRERAYFNFQVWYYPADQIAWERILSKAQKDKLRRRFKVPECQFVPQHPNLPPNLRPTEIVKKDCPEQLAIISAALLNFKSTANSETNNTVIQPAQGQSSQLNSPPIQLDPNLAPPEPDSQHSQNTTTSLSNPPLITSQPTPILPQSPTTIQNPILNSNPVSTLTSGISQATISSENQDVSSTPSSPQSIPINQSQSVNKSSSSNDPILPRTTKPRGRPALALPFSPPPSRSQSSQISKPTAVHNSTAVSNQLRRGIRNSRLRAYPELGELSSFKIPKRLLKGTSGRQEPGNKSGSQTRVESNMDSGDESDSSSNSGDNTTGAKPIPQARPNNTQSISQQSNTQHVTSDPRSHSRTSSVSAATAISDSSQLSSSVPPITVQSHNIISRTKPGTKQLRQSTSVNPTTQPTTTLAFRTTVPSRNAPSKRRPSPTSSNGTETTGEIQRTTNIHSIVGPRVSVSSSPNPSTAAIRLRDHSPLRAQTSQSTRGERSVSTAEPLPMVQPGTTRVLETLSTTTSHSEPTLLLSTSTGRDHHGPQRRVSLTRTSLLERETLSTILPSTTFHGGIRRQTRSGERNTRRETIRSRSSSRTTNEPSSSITPTVVQHSKRSRDVPRVGSSTNVVSGPIRNPRYTRMGASAVSTSVPVSLPSPGESAMGVHSTTGSSNSRTAPGASMRSTNSQTNSTLDSNVDLMGNDPSEDGFSLPINTTTSSAPLIPFPRPDSAQTLSSQTTNHNQPIPIRQRSENRRNASVSTDTDSDSDSSLDIGSAELTSPFTATESGSFIDAIKSALSLSCSCEDGQHHQTQNSSLSYGIREYVREFLTHYRQQPPPLRRPIGASVSPKAALSFLGEYEFRAMDWAELLDAQLSLPNEAEEESPTVSTETRRSVLHIRDTKAWRPEFLNWSWDIDSFWFDISGLGDFKCALGIHYTVQRRRMISVPTKSLENIQRAQMAHTCLATLSMPGGECQLYISFPECFAAQGKSFPNYLQEMFIDRIWIRALKRVCPPEAFQDHPTSYGHAYSGAIAHKELRGGAAHAGMGIVYNLHADYLGPVWKQIQRRLSRSSLDPLLQQFRRPVLTLIGHDFKRVFRSSIASCAGPDQFLNHLSQFVFTERYLGSHYFKSSSIDIGFELNTSRDHPGPPNTMLWRRTCLGDKIRQVFLRDDYHHSPTSLQFFTWMLTHDAASATGENHHSKHPFVSLIAKAKWYSLDKHAYANSLNRELFPFIGQFLQLLPLTPTMFEPFLRYFKARQHARTYDRIVTIMQQILWRIREGHTGLGSRHSGVRFEITSSVRGVRALLSHVSQNPDWWNSTVEPNLNEASTSSHPPVFTLASSHVADFQESIITRFLWALQGIRYNPAADTPMYNSVLVRQRLATATVLLKILRRLFTGDQHKHNNLNRDWYKPLAKSSNGRAYHPPDNEDPNDHSGELRGLGMNHIIHRLGVYWLPPDLFSFDDLPLLKFAVLPRLSAATLSCVRVSKIAWVTTTEDPSRQLFHNDAIHHIIIKSARAAAASVTARDLFRSNEDIRYVAALRLACALQPVTLLVVRAFIHWICTLKYKNEYVFPDPDDATVPYSAGEFNPFPIFTYQRAAELVDGWPIIKPNRKAKAASNNTQRGNVYHWVDHLQKFFAPRPPNTKTGWNWLPRQSYRIEMDLYQAQLKAAGMPQDWIDIWQSNLGLYVQPWIWIVPNANSKGPLTLGPESPRKKFPRKRMHWTLPIYWPVRDPGTPLEFLETHHQVDEMDESTYLELIKDPEELTNIEETAMRIVNIFSLKRLAELAFDNESISQRRVDAVVTHGRMAQKAMRVVTAHKPDLEEWAGAFFFDSGGGRPELDDLEEEIEKFSKDEATRLGVADWAEPTDPGSTSGTDEEGSQESDSEIND